MNHATEIFDDRNVEVILKLEEFKEFLVHCWAVLNIVVDILDMLGQVVSNFVEPCEEDRLVES